MLYRDSPRRTGVRSAALLSPFSSLKKSRHQKCPLSASPLFPWSYPSWRSAPQEKKSRKPRPLISFCACRQMRRLDATGSFLLVPDLHRAARDQAALDTATTGARPGSSRASLGSAGAGPGAKAGRAAGRRRQRGPVNWEAVAAGRPYCRAAAQGKGLTPSPDAETLAFRDAYFERWGGRGNKSLPLLFQTLPFFTLRSKGTHKMHTIVPSS